METAEQSSAAQRLQAQWRGRNARKERGRHGVARRFSSLAEDTARAMEDAAKTTVKAVLQPKNTIVKYAKKRARNVMQKLIESRLASLYETKIKLMVTPDRRMPWSVRQSVHTLVDLVWVNVTEEVIRAFEKMDAADEANLGTEDATGKKNNTVFGRQKSFLNAGGLDSLSSSPCSQRKPMCSPPPSPPEADPSASPGGSAAEPPPQPSGAGAKRSFSFKKRVLSKRAAPAQQQQPPTEAAEEEEVLLPQPVRLPPPVPPRTLRPAQPPAAAAPSAPPLVRPRRQLPPPPAPAPACAQLFSSAGAPSSAPDGEHAWEMSSSEDSPQGKVQSSVWRLLAALSYWARRQLGTASIRFVVRGARGLINTDVTGKSDPYTKLSIGSYHWNTRTVQDSLDPVWNEEHTVTGPLHDLLARPMVLEVFDDDSIITPIGFPAFGASLDDSLGFVELPIRLLDELLAGEGSGDFELRLSTQGSITVGVAVSELLLPPWSEVVHLQLKNHVYPVLTPVLAFVRDVPAVFVGLLRQLTDVCGSVTRLRELSVGATVRVSLLRAYDLRNADFNFLGEKSDVSDPFVTLSLGLEDKRSKTVPDSLAPEWNEEFEFHGVVGDLLAHPLLIEVLDEDVIFDESLGGTEVSTEAMEELIAAAAGRPPNAEPRPLELSLPLSTQGTIVLKVVVTELHEPSTLDLWWEAVRPQVLAFRAFFLYHRLPYDRTIFSKIRDWRFLLVMYIAASPELFTRALFFTIYLAAIIVEHEEYQLMRFIMSLKGTQFISGIFKFIKLCFAFWQCAVLSQETDGSDGCATSGPSVGESVPAGLALLLWLQLLLWFAFLLLPFAATFDQHTGALDYTRSHKMWADARRSVESGGRQPTIVKGRYGAFAREAPAAGGEQALSSIAGAMAGSVVGNAVGCASTVVSGAGVVVGGAMVGARSAAASLRSKGTGLLSRVGGVRSRGSKGGAGSSVGVAGGGVGAFEYEQLGDVEASAAGVEEEPPHAPDVGAGSGSWRGGEDGVGAPGGNGAPPSGTGGSWSARARARLISVRRAFLILSYPIRSGTFRNRLASLLHWDQLACATCLAVFLAMIAAAAHADEHRIKADAERWEVSSGGGDDAPMQQHGHAAALRTARSVESSRPAGRAERSAPQHRSAAPRRTLRSLHRSAAPAAQVTFAVVKLVFALSAAPFFCFTLGPVGKVFAHADPTAYTPSGRLAQTDTSGLSAYLAFWKEDVLESERFRQELDTTFTPAEMQKVHSAVESGERCLEDAWQRPGTVKRTTLRKKREIDDLLRTIITRDRASEALYRQCFPDRVLVEQFVRAQARSKVQAD